MEFLNHTYLLCSTHLIFKVSIDNKGECKLLTFEEMQKLVSDGVKLTAELVQPRLSIVRLYLSGQRIGYQSSDQQSSKEPV